MPSLVPLPELQKGGITGQQAVQKPHREGVSQFLQRFLPEVTKGVQAYQQENQSRLHALGMNDELNKVQRDIASIDRKNYEQGIEHQKVISTQMYNEDTFQNMVKTMAQEGKNFDEIWDASQVFLRDNVDVVYGSGLDSDIKENLYENNLKRNIAFQKHVHEAIQAAATERFERNKVNFSAGIYKRLSTATSPEEQSLYVSSFIDTATGMYVDAGYSTKEAIAGAHKDLEGVLTFMATQLKDPSQANAQQAVAFGQLVDSGVRDGWLPMTTATQLQGMIADIHSNVWQRNDEVLDQELAQFELDLSADPKADYNNLVRGALMDLQVKYDNGEITHATFVKYQKKYTDLAISRNNALLNRSEKMTVGDFFTNLVSRDQWILDGGSVTDFVSFYERKAIELGGGDPIAAAHHMFDMARKGDLAGQPIPELAKKAGERYNSSVIGTMLHTGVELEKGEFGEAQVKRFDALGEFYRAIRTENPALTHAFMDGFDPDKRGIIEDVWWNNRSVADAKNRIDSPATYKKQSDDLKAATSALTVKDFTATFGTSATGSKTSFWQTRKRVDDAWLGLLKTAINDEHSDLLSDTQTADPFSLAGRVKSTHLIPSQTVGYSDIIISPSARKRLTGALDSTMGGNSLNYVRRAIDEERTRLIKEYKVKDYQVMVNIDQTGYTRFRVLDEDGVAFKNTPPEGIGMNQTKLIQRARAEYTKDTTKPQEASFSQKYLGSRAPVGQVYVPELKGNLKYGSEAAKVFGGNLEFTRDFLHYIVGQEGFVSTPTQSGVPASGGQRSVSVAGFGMNLNAHGNVKSPNGKTWGERVRAASGDSQAILDINIEFLAYHHKDMQSYLKKYNLPQMSSAPYPKDFKPAALLIADAYWLGGGGGADNMGKILQSRNYTEAMKKYKANKAFNSFDKSGGSTRRNYAMRGLLRDYFSR